MPTPLPDWNDPVRSLADLLGVCARRLQQARSVDPHGGFEPPSFELTSRAQALTLFGAVAMILVTLVTLIFTRGPVFLALAGVTVALVGYVGLSMRAANRHVAKWRSEGVVAGAAIVMANSRLFEAGQLMMPGVVVYSFDPQLGRSGHGLVDLAERLGALKNSGLDGLAPDVRALAARLQSERPTWRRVRVPRELCGNDRTWMADLACDRKRMPHGLIDRRLWPVLVHETIDLDSTAMLPLQLWWREDLDGFSQALGTDGGPG